MAFIGRVLCGVSGEKDDEEEEVVKNRAPPAPTRSLSISCRKVRQLYEFHLTWSMLCVVLCVEQRIIFHLDRYVCARVIALVIRPMHCLWRWRYYSTWFFFLAILSNIIALFVWKLLNFCVYFCLFHLKSATCATSHRHHRLKRNSFGFSSGFWNNSHAD